MSVIINDFEVVVEQPQAAPLAAGTHAPAEEASKPKLAPLDIEDVLRRKERREWRRRAH